VSHKIEDLIMRTPARPLLAASLSLLIGVAVWAEDYSADATPNQRPMLGVEMTPVPANIQDREGIDAHTGVLVQSTYSGTAADAMGLRKDDVILGINGAPIGSMTDLRNEVGLTMVGDQVEVQVSRNGQIASLRSEIKPWPAQIPYEKLDAAAEKRFRDWQDRRQQRLNDEVERLAKDTERLRQKLSGDEPSTAGNQPFGDDLAGFAPAFRFHYAIDPARLPAAEPTDLGVRPLPDLAIAGATGPWKISVAVGSTLTTL
jgi:HAMP domain-containing protein